MQWGRDEADRGERDDPGRANPDPVTTLPPISSSATARPRCHGLVLPELSNLFP